MTLRSRNKARSHRGRQRFEPHVADHRRSATIAMRTIHYVCLRVNFEKCQPQLTPQSAEGCQTNHGIAFSTSSWLKGRFTTDLDDMQLSENNDVPECIGAVNRLPFCAQQCQLTAGNCHSSHQVTSDSSTSSHQLEIENVVR